MEMAVRVNLSATIRVMAPEVRDAYASLMIDGIERRLRTNRFYYLKVQFKHRR
jgi:hypothetical protein